MKDLHTWTNKEIMTQAWKLSRQATAHHGKGKPSEYFSAFLKAVWAKVKAARTQHEAMIIGSNEWNRRVAACIANEQQAA